MKETSIFDAIEFAAKAHHGHYRKGTNIPYMTHLIRVMDTLLRFGYEERVAIAGLLHDVVEDTSCTLDDVEASFGKDVANLVKGATEPDKLFQTPNKQEAPWKERKTHTIQQIQTESSEEVLAIICTDKLDNIQSISRDLGQIGDELWSRFNAPYPEQEWYYQSLAKGFQMREGEFTDRFKAMSGTFRSVVKEVFKTRDR